MTTKDILFKLNLDLAPDDTAVLVCGTVSAAKALYMQYSRAIKRYKITTLKVSRKDKTLTFSRPTPTPTPVIQKEGKEVL